MRAVVGESVVGKRGVFLVCLRERFVASGINALYGVTPAVFYGVGLSVLYGARLFPVPSTDPYLNYSLLSTHY